MKKALFILMCIFACEMHALEQDKTIENRETPTLSANDTYQTPDNSHEITIEIKIACPMSAELETFVQSIPKAGTYSTSLEEWKSSFINNMTQLIQLVESEKFYHSFWSVKTDDALKEFQEEKTD